jgi:hypothetical protein
MPENTRAQMLPTEKKNEINERTCTVISFASVNGLKVIAYYYIMDNENKQIITLVLIVIYYAPF